ncbi:MAG: transglutaminase domain-containing protein [Acutalibacteraceae bacterium]
MRKKSEKTESFSELLRAGRIRVRVPRRGAVLGLGGLLALFCGAGALLLLAGAAFNLLRFDLAAALGFAAGTSVLVWATRFFARRRGLWACAAAGLAACAVWALYPYTLLPKCRLLWVLLQNDPYLLLKFDMTEVVCLAAAALVLFLYLLAFVLHIGWAAYGLSVPLAVQTAALGQLPFWAVPMLVLFHAEAHLEAAQGGGDTVRGARRPAAGRGSLLLAAVVCACFFAGYALLEPHIDALLALPRRVQDVILPENTDAGDTGRTSAVSSGRYTTGEEALAVTLDSYPAGPFYLRNFYGGVYENGRWSAVDESEFLAELEGEGDGGALWIESGGGMYAPADAEQIVVTRLNGSAPGDYTPYHAVLWGSDGDTDRFIASESAGFGSLPTGVQYARFAENMYTAVPDSLERLRAFCRENPQSGFENTRDFILRALHGAAEYTLSPGLVPPGADPAEYFFFDNRRGYCEHFATTAALLFRLYGYPARYAVGYVADDFTRQADGAYQAVLTDREAHAWVEVFADGAWTPVEATPPGAVVEAPAENDVRPVEVLTGDAVSPSPAPTQPPKTAQAEAAGTPSPTARPTAVPQEAQTPRRIGRKSRRIGCFRAGRCRHWPLWSALRGSLPARPCFPAAGGACAVPTPARCSCSPCAFCSARGCCAASTARSGISPRACMRLYRRSPPRRRRRLRRTRFRRRSAGQSQGPPTPKFTGRAGKRRPKTAGRGGNSAFLKNTRASRAATARFLRAGA